MPDCEKFPSDNIVVQDTITWLERAVIGLNLCPFAKSVHVKGLVHYVVSKARTTQQLADDLVTELRALQAVKASVRDTTLLIAPHCVSDFFAFNEFLGQAEQILADLDLDGVLQIASLHPHYQFAGTGDNDISNFTNRSPYPTLHLLREASVERAVQAFPDARIIFQNNIQTLENLGLQGWSALGVGPTVVDGHRQSKSAQDVFEKNEAVP